MTCCSGPCTFVCNLGNADHCYANQSLARNWTAWGICVSSMWVILTKALEIVHCLHALTWDLAVARGSHFTHLFTLLCVSLYLDDWVRYLCSSAAFWRTSGGEKTVQTSSGRHWKSEPKHWLHAFWTTNLIQRIQTGQALIVLELYVHITLVIVNLEISKV